MLTATLTACDTNKPSDSSSSTSSTESSSSESSSSESSSTESSSTDSSTENSESAPDSSSNDDIVVPDDPNNPGDSNEGVDNSGLEFPDNRAGALAKAALAEDAWPAVDIVPDAETIGLMFSADFNTDSYEEYCFCTNFISVALNKVIVIKPKEGKEEEVSSALDAYLEAVQTDPNIAFYPAQELSAAGAVTGKTDDGYYYMIVHENGADIAAAMVEAQ